MKLKDLFENNRANIIRTGRQKNEEAFMFFDSNGPDDGHEDEWSKLEQEAINIGNQMEKIEKNLSSANLQQYVDMIERLEGILYSAEEIQYQDI